MKINAGIVDRIINKHITQKEQNIFEEIVGQDIRKFVDHNFLALGIVSFDIGLVDDCLNLPDGISMGKHAERFGREKADVFYRLCCETSIPVLGK